MGMITIDSFNTDVIGVDEELKAYTADFETTTDENDCRVWAYAICEIDNPENVIYGNSIKGFIEWCEYKYKAQLYFHNLGFDGAFILDYLERNGWEWTDDTFNVRKYNYTTLINDMNQIYSITLYFSKTSYVRIYDSLKIIPLSIKAMAKAYNLPIQKEELDYKAYREIGHELTEEEKFYIKHDVQIAAMVLKEFLDNDLNRMTAGSNALHNYKQMLGGQKGFRKFYPYLNEEIDNFIRGAYRGGFTYVNPKFQGKKLGDGIVLDVNSLYPSVMHSCDGQLLPHGDPIWYDGEYDEEIYGTTYPLWVGCVSLYFKLKPNHIPCIQLKGNSMFKSTEYIEDSKTIITITITSVDWKLIQQQYDCEFVEWHGGYMFKADNFMFTDYVDKWISVKNQATIDGNAGKRQIAKLMLNSLYGKFATRLVCVSRKPVLIDNVIKYVDLEPETRDPVYLPVGVFITAHARYKTITSAQSVYERFIYADTDSLHLIGTEIPDNLDVDNVRLGAWKHESTFDSAKFLRAKCYIEHEVGADSLTVHVAGMPQTCHKEVTFENFEFGNKFYGKLYQHRVNGGIVLTEDFMTLRE